MKNGKRIAAFALSLVVALGSVCYRPPKAEAVVFESAALVSALTSTYLSSTGFSFSANADNWDADAVNERIYNETRQFFVDVYSAYVETEEEFYALLCDGAEILTNGAVKFSAAAANMLGDFSAWLIEKFNLGPDVVYAIPLDPILTTDGIPLTYAYVQDTPSVILTPGVSYSFDSGYKFINYKTSDGYYIYELYYNGAYKSSFGNAGTYALVLPINVNSNRCAYLDEDNNVVNYGINFSYRSWSVLGIDAAPNIDAKLDITLPADYEAAPEVDEQYAMVVNTGLTFADEQSYIDAVLGGIAAGTLSPTYTIESTTAGDVTVPGEDAEDDTQVGILSWTKKIWQSVVELPKSIADAIANVFVPSDEYLAVLPETIADTFDGRTGILTYPTTVLYDFADRIAGGQQDFILSWPTVREPYTNGVMMEAGQFNVSKFVRENQTLSDWYVIYQYAVGVYLTFLFLGLCSRKYNSIVGDSSGV